MRKLALAVVAAGLLTAAAGAGVTGPAFYVDGQLYRTVNTPTDLSERARRRTRGTRSTTSAATR